MRRGRRRAIARQLARLGIDPREIRAITSRPVPPDPARKETQMPDQVVPAKARRGDLAVIERVRVERTSTGRAEISQFAVTLVSNLTQDGRVKAIRDLRWGDDAYTQHLDRIVGFRRVYLIAKSDVDIAAALATVRAHVYPGSTTPRDYDSLDDVRAALRPHLIGSGA